MGLRMLRKTLSKASRGYSGSDRRLKHWPLSLYLHVEFIAPRPTLTALRHLMAQGEPIQVWTDAGSYLGTYAVKDVSWRNQWDTADRASDIDDC